VTIREAKPEDAEQFIAFFQRLDDEPDGMIPSALSEFQITIEQGRHLLNTYLTTKNSAFFVAEVEGHIVGVLNCDGGKRQATRHNASFGIAVAREQRNKGIGTALLSHLIEWAKDMGVLKRLELEVYAHNAPAIHLYRKFGFVEEGKRQSAYFQHEEFLDGLLMVYRL
jgi:ribosomal protein S18 acetylase RimI-like enzyme